MTRRYVPIWRQAEPFRMTRRDNVHEVIEILKGLAVLGLVGLAVWLWLAIGVASQMGPSR